MLLRSFSALTLSMIAARDNESPFLSTEDSARLLQSALDYFRDERDTRGFDTDKGWMHSAAHTSDLLKFLARSLRFRPARRHRFCPRWLAKNRDAAAPFVQGEDERMARIAISIVRRADFDREAPCRVDRADADDGGEVSRARGCARTCGRSRTPGIC